MTSPIFSVHGRAGKRAPVLETILTSGTRTDKPADLCGILAIDKPTGITSHDVVSRVRRLVGMKRVGHGGTLDPFASGVLIVAVGRATRLLQYVQNSNKSYEADIVLGISTDSGDVDGTIISQSEPDSWPTLDAVEHALSLFTGEIQQVPPAHSAIKIGGRKLYELARAGEVVDVPARTVTVHAIEIIDYSPPNLRVVVHCSKGTYIRAIARDIGAALDVGAYCHGLRRIRNGRFGIEECRTLDELAEADIRSNWIDVALQPDAAVIHLTLIALNEEATTAWYHGRPINLNATQSVQDGISLRVYDESGQFLGIGIAEPAGVVRPKLVLPTAGEDNDE